MAWRFPCEVISNYDGDSIRVMADLGFSTYRKIKLRLEKVDTPEINRGSELTKSAARFIRDEVGDFLKAGDSLILVSSKVEGLYGRAVGDIEVDGSSLGEWLLEKGYAIPYITGHRTKELVQAQHETLALGLRERKLIL